MPAITTYTCTLTKNVPSTPKVGDIILIYFLDPNKTVSLEYFKYDNELWASSNNGDYISTKIQDNKCILEFDSVIKSIPYQAIYIPFENVSNIDFTT